FQAEDGIRDFHVTGVQTCALPICRYPPYLRGRSGPWTCRSELARDVGGTACGPSPASWLLQLGARFFRCRNLRRCFPAPSPPPEIGRASCRERVWIQAGDGV